MHLPDPLSFLPRSPSRPIVILLGLFAMFLSLLVVVGSVQNLLVNADTERCWDGTYQGRRICYRDFYRSLTRDEGPLLALADLAERQEKATLAVNCHEIVHDIGEEAARHESSLPTLFENGTAVCRAGYYHGVLTEYIRSHGTSETLAELGAVCDELPGKGTGTDLYRHCTHGVGHGLMFATKGDVFKSILLCDAFSSVYDQKECAGGVYMEHLMADGVEHVSKQMNTTTPETLCLEMEAGAYRDVCLERLGTYYAQISYPQTWGGFDLCRERLVSAKDRTLCIRGIGLLAVGEEEARPRDPSIYCRFGKVPEERVECFAGAMITLHRVLPQVGDATSVICERTGSQYLPLCEKAAELVRKEGVIVKTGE